MNEIKLAIEENKEAHTVRLYSYCDKCGCTHIDPATHPFTCDEVKAKVNANGK